MIKINKALFFAIAAAITPISSQTEAQEKLLGKWECKVAGFEHNITYLSFIDDKNYQLEFSGSITGLLEYGKYKVDGEVISYTNTRRTVNGKEHTLRKLYSHEIKKLENNKLVYEYLTGVGGKSKMKCNRK